MLGASSVRTVASGGLPGAIFRKVEAYIDSMLHDSIGLSELAAIAGLSIRHFSRAFLVSTGQTPARFVHERRLHHAMQMLACRKLTITEIAFACGFSHAQHFTNSFRRSMAMTPSEYRQRLLG
jgi:AraC family transcriptional regulator